MMICRSASNSILPSQRYTDSMAGSRFTQAASRSVNERACELCRVGVSRQRGQGDYVVRGHRASLGFLLGKTNFEVGFESKLLYKGRTPFMATAPITPAAPDTARRKREQPEPSPFPARRKTVQLLLLFVTLVLIIDALVGEKGLLETMRASRQHQELTASIERLRLENNRLREQVGRLRDDPATIESVAREELGLIRPGELLFIVKDAKPGR